MNRGLLALSVASASCSMSVCLLFSARAAKKLAQRPKKIVGVDDEKQLPYTAFETTVLPNGGINWKRVPKPMVTFERIQELLELSTENAKKLPTEDKRLWLYLQIDRDKRAAGRGNDIFSAEPILLLVEREHFLRDSFEQFKTTTDLDLRREIKIHFLNEVCQDAGGLIREWFSVLMEELFDPKFGLFVAAKTQGELSYLFNEYSEKYHTDHLDYFYFCGQVTAKALYERIPIKAYLNRIIFMQLLGAPLSKDDLKYVDDELFGSIQFILNTQIDKEVGLGNFTITKKDPVTSAETLVELIENGSNIPITDANKLEFAELFFQHSFVIPTASQVKSFTAGFHSLLPLRIISALEPEELEFFICGDTTLDIKDWQENTTYASPYNVAHPVIRRFWEMIYKMSVEEREKLLQFCTGSKRVPAEGFKGLRAANGKISKFRIEPRTLDEKGSAFIVAHTCFNKLELPMYQDLTTMQTCVKKVLECPSYFQFTFE